jgi:2-keto-4-pentenoate hydratase/2-oxohepta-3-ene-1,7-dioic acid hydratase in catechol pathway
VTRWCRFATPRGELSFGVVEDGQVREADDPFLGSGRVRGASYPLTEVRLLPPVVPSTFFCVGLNYRRHIEHAVSMGYANISWPERPEVGYRANNALVGHEDDIVMPADVTGRFEAEGELVAVIGTRLRNCTPEEARAGVFGWTIGNDVSAREWQHSDRTFWRSKNADTFKPMGPWIVTDVDALAATTTIRVNDVEVSRFPTGDMVFDPYRFITEISRYCTLSPGDVLWMGADGAAAIGDGDSVEIAISGIGTLRNRVVRAAPSRGTAGTPPTTSTYISAQP